MDNEGEGENRAVDRRWNGKRSGRTQDRGKEKIRSVKRGCRNMYTKIKR